MGHKFCRLAKGSIDFSMAKSMLAREKVFDHKPNKALGIIWDPITDMFTFNADQIKSGAETHGDAITKRQLFSLGLKIYDPLGLIAPVTLKAKIAMQSIWLDTTKWDQSIKAERLPLWKKYLESLTGLEQIEVSRHIKTDPSQPSEIHIFCDASEQAYGAVAYEVQNGQISLIAAKTRVAPAPKRALSIPRLELLSNLIATELGRYILKQHQTNHKITIWTDSQVALAWVSAADKHPEIWIQNRVTKIREAEFRTRYCEGVMNPADHASRGLKALTLKTSNWATGPPWLTNAQTYRPTSPQRPKPEVTVNHIYINWTAVRKNEKDFFWKNYSSVHRMTRAMAVLRRAANCFKGIKVEHHGKLLVRTKPRIEGNRETRKYSIILQAEYDDAKDELFRLAQKEGYPDLYRRLVNGKKPLYAKDKKFNPFMDTKTGLIRCVGRQAALFDANKKDYPILLPTDSHLTQVILREMHEDSGKLAHQGLKAVLTRARHTYWIPKQTRPVIKMLNQCIICKMTDAHKAKQIPARLPIQRMRLEDPFATTGIDFAGPFNVLKHKPKGGDRFVFEKDEIPPEDKTARKRTAKTAEDKEKDKAKKRSPKERHAYYKFWIVIFTCATKRAVHLEVVQDQEISTFINAFRRFIALRFLPRTVISDNAGTFLAMARYIENLKESESLQTMFEKMHIAWNFNAPCAPWWSGFWERLVGSVKRSLTKNFGHLKMDYDLFHTAVVEISAAINNRPLVWLIKENIALTPNQLLKGGFSEFEMRGLRPDESDEIVGEGTTPLKRREMARRDLILRWWKDFYTFYLLDLKRFYLPGPDTVADLQEKQLVLLSDDNAKRVDWKIAQIIEVRKGKDGQKRTCKIATLDYKKKRTEFWVPWQRLYPLEVSPRGMKDKFKCVTPKEITAVVMEPEHGHVPGGVLNSREGLTQTGDLASRSREGTLTARTARAQKATATPKSPKGETRKRAAKAAEGKTKMGTRQPPSKQAERRQSGNGASSVNDDSGSEDQNNSVSLDGDVEDATQSVQIVWYESDYEAQHEASNSVDGGKDANPSTPMLWYESDYGARQESSGSE